MKLCMWKLLQVCSFIQIQAGYFEIFYQVEFYVCLFTLNNRKPNSKLGYMVQGFISSQKSNGRMEFRCGLIRALAHWDSSWFYILVYWLAPQAVYAQNGKGRAAVAALYLPNILPKFKECEFWVPNKILSSALVGAFLNQPVQFSSWRSCS